MVLVHGAYADGSSWSEVIERLQRAGLAAAVQNPLTSLADDVAHTRRILALHDGPVILAGHSFAGTVISEAGIDPRVWAWSISRLAPPTAGMRTTPRSPRSSRQFYLLTPGLSPTGGGFGGPPEDAFLNRLRQWRRLRSGRGVPYGVQGRVSESLFHEKTTAAAWRSKPSWYAISRQDRTISPELQRFLAKRMNATTVEIDSGHLSLITHPQEVTQLILSAAGRPASMPRQAAIEGE